MWPLEDHLPLLFKKYCREYQKDFFFCRRDTGVLLPHYYASRNFLRAEVTWEQFTLCLSQKVNDSLNPPMSWSVVLVWDAIIKYPQTGVAHTTNWKLESPRSRCQPMRSLVKIFFLVMDSTFWLNHHMAER